MSLLISHLPYQLVNYYSLWILIITLNTDRMPPPLIDIPSLITNPPFLTIPQLQSYKNKFSTIETFMNNPRKNIGFFIGASGSGKHYLTKSYLEAEGIKYVVLPPFINEEIQGFCKQAYMVDNVIICREFFKPTQRNAGVFFREMREFTGKIIFVLNSSEYSYSGIKKFMKSKSGREVNQLANAVFCEFGGYNKTQMKNLVAMFSKKAGCHLTYSPSFLSELTDLYEGDSRRILNEVYLRSRTSAGLKLEDTDSNKVSIFHFLGKLLYNKRLVVGGIEPKDAKKCRKGLYRQMSPEEHKKFEPPFYFNPLDLMKESNLPFEIILGFLFENYRRYYSSIENSKNFNELVARLQISKKEVKESWKVEQEFDTLKDVLLSYGVMIYNTHGAEKKSTFQSFEGPKMWQYNRSETVKQELLDRNIPEFSINTLNQLHDLGRYFPHHMFNIVSVINKIWNTHSSNFNDNSLSQNEQKREQTSQGIFNRKTKFQRNAFEDYDEISSDDN